MSYEVRGWEYSYSNHNGTSPTAMVCAMANFSNWNLMIFGLCILSSIFDLHFYTSIIPDYGVPVSILVFCPVKLLIILNLPVFLTLHLVNGGLLLFSCLDSSASWMQCVVLKSRALHPLALRLGLQCGLEDSLGPGMLCD